MTAVDPYGKAWSMRIRPGFRVLRVGQEDAQLYAGRPLARAGELLLVDRSGAERLERVGVAPGLQACLYAVALLYAVLGSVVFRWAGDRRLGALFLFFTSSFAVSFALIPWALATSLWDDLILGSVGAALVPASFTLFALFFPSPVSFARGALRLLTATSVAVAVVLLLLNLDRREVAMAWAEDISGPWTAANLALGCITLAARAWRPTDRARLAPVAWAAVAGVTPYLLLNSLQESLGRRPLVGVEAAALSLGAIPLGFGFAILRHRLFALDILLRRSVVWLGTAFVLVGAFGLARALARAAGIEVGAAGLVAAGGIAFGAPAVHGWTGRALDRWLYPRVRPGLSGRTLFESGTVAGVAEAVALRARELAPVRWAACLVLADPTEPGPLRRAAADGQDAPDLPGLASPEEAAALGRSVPLSHAGQHLGLLVLGSRLDGTPATAEDAAAVARACRPAGALLEVALWREHAQAQTRHRTASLVAARGPAHPPADRLTPREREVARLVARGLTNRQIARELGISEKTAGKHLENLTRKLGFQSRAQVAAWATAGGTAPLEA